MHKLSFAMLATAILASAVGCAPFLMPAPTAIPFSTITPTAPIVPLPSPTVMASATASPLATTPVRASATASPTGLQKAGATPTRSPSRPAASPTATPALVVQSVLVAPGQPGRLYALLSDQIDSSEHKVARLLVSDDMGAMWSPFAGGLPVSQNCMNNVNLDYGTTDSLFASTCQGIYRWTGSKWTLVSNLRTRAVAVTYHQPSNIWAATQSSNEGPVVHSTDGGATWQPGSIGLVHFNGVADIGIDPRDARTLYAIIMPKYGGSYLRRKIGDNQWETMPTPMNNAQIDVGMTIDGATGALYVTVFDGTTTPGQGHWQVWRSSSPAVEMNSVKWERVYDFGGAQWATMLASGWSPQGLALYARVRLATDDQALMRSLDSGKTWNVVKIP